VAESRHQYRREILARLFDGRPQALHVVVLEVQEVGAVFGRHPGNTWRTPWQRAVIAAACDQHLAAAGTGAGNRHAAGGRIAAVFLKHRPICMWQHGDEVFGEFHHDLPRAIEAISFGSLRLSRRLNFGMPMAKHNRPPAAHEIDIFAPIDVAHAATFRGGKELRITFREPRSVEMAPHAAWNHQLRPCAQQGIRGLRFAQQRRVLAHHVLLSGLQGLPCASCRRP
jgi:hypothetical protein